MNTVIVLVGPKGAGKSTIGHLLATELGIHFLRVEPLFLALREELGASHPELEQRGFRSVLKRVLEDLARYDTVCFETTGASTYVTWLVSELDRAARVLLVRVLATHDQSLERIRSRDSSLHIPVSDDQVERINAIAERVELPWAAEIDNRGAFDPAAVIETIRHLVSREEQRGT